MPNLRKHNVKITKAIVDNMVIQTNVELPEDLELSRGSTKKYDYIYDTVKGMNVNQWATIDVKIPNGMNDEQVSALLAATSSAARNAANKYHGMKIQSVRDNGSNSPYGHMRIYFRIIPN